MTARLLTPAEAARAEARAVLLRCWLRETAIAVSSTGPQVLSLPATGRSLVVDVDRVSPTGVHGLGDARLPDGRALPVEELARLLCAEAAARAGLPSSRGDAAAARVADSVRRAARYATVRAAETAAPDLPGWLEAEQGLLAGHPFHPVAKAREDLRDSEDDLLAPELRGAFPLHWLAARPHLVSTGAGGLPAVVRRDAAVPQGYVAVPAHPWQAVRLSQRPDAAALLEAGDLLDLGPAGPAWWATSSVRTVARPDLPWMLKLSLGLRVTNSRRENVRSELHLGERAAQIAGALAPSLLATHPQFGLVTDPAWIGVDGGDVGLDTVVRERPFGNGDRVACAGALVDARPDRGRPVVADLTAGDAVSWYRAYLRVVALPLLWLHGTHGIGLEAHLQNLLVGLDGRGTPDRAWYRDNQGWYLAESHAADVERLLPGVTDGVPLVFDDDLVTRRVVYYVGVNALLGVAGALAAADLADERALLEVLAGALRAHLSGTSPSAAAAVLLDAEHLPVKANLLTTVDGRDELDGPVATQSVYVDVPNPLRGL